MYKKQLCHFIPTLIALGCCLFTAVGNANEESGGAADAQESGSQSVSENESSTSKDAEGAREADRAPNESQEVNLPLAGHSEHGAAYNEGPRQNAYLMGGTGEVHFPVTTDVAEAEAFFTQGIGQLHGFWYYEAERTFRRVASLDPDCAMAYWGLAQANLENKERAKQFIVEAFEKKDSATQREQMYIDALHKYLTAEKKEKDRRRDYIRGLEKIIREFPDDIEAKAFLAVHLWQSNRHGVPLNSHQAVDSLLGDIFRVQPMHPAHHFRIHLWDDEEPPQALASAALCGQAAPTIAHMWHMPGHIYSRLKRYDDAVWQQEASARADHAHMMRDRVLPDQIHNYAHNNEWLIRNLIHLGRATDALALAKNMLELPRHPKFNSFEKDGMCSCKYGRRRLFQVLDAFQMWDELLALIETMYFEPTDNREEQGKRLRLLGVAHYHRGQGSELTACIDALEQLIAGIDAEAEKKAREASQNVKQDDANADEETEKKEEKSAEDEAAKKAKRERKKLVQSVAELKGLQWLARGETEFAKEQFEQADVPKQRMILYCFLTGNHARAEKLAEDYVQSSENEVPPLAVQVDILRRMGKLDDARKAFESLRKVAGSADLDSPLLNRLSGLAQEFEWPEDWRVAPVQRDDVGKRPDLSTLGPTRWGPSPALPWSLADSTSAQQSLAAYQGRPVVMIFYLGFGCLHCVEQLHAFAPLVKDFEAAGISLVAISIESPEEINRALKDFSNEGIFPIPLVPNPQLDVFKAYRVFDDFEQMPLHGTFLIDGQGMVRWHDISYEPFLKPDLLLNEAKRLLSLTTKDAKLANESIFEAPDES